MELANEKWQPARLIPTSGITGQEEAERRATSALLAVLQSVTEFRNALLKPLGAPAGALEAFIEVPFETADDRTVYPDGALVVRRGKTTWVALVEVKTGDATLEQPQLETYLDIARANGISTVLSISNEIAPSPGVHPVAVDKRKLRSVDLRHLSWAEVLTLAVQTRVHHGVSDPDQAWILGELIRYLEHPKSGAFDFSDMGSSWVAVRDAVAAGTLRAGDKGVDDVVSRWDQLLRFEALRLGRETGADVQVVVARKHQSDPSARTAAHVATLVDSGRLEGVIRIPGSCGDVGIVADLRAGTVTVGIELNAPQDGRLATQVKWLVRQLKEGEVPDKLRIDGLLAGSKSTTSELLGAVRNDPSILLDPSGRDFRAFRVSAPTVLGTKRGTGRGSFIDSVLAAVDGFYEGVVQNLQPWTPKAPKLPKSGQSATGAAGIRTDLPPQDGPPPYRPVASASAPSPPPFVPPSADPSAPSERAIAWEHAEARIERERLGATPGGDEESAEN
jgi:hypothetical protein